MFLSTISKCVCPVCESKVKWDSKNRHESTAKPANISRSLADGGTFAASEDIRTGFLLCTKCAARFPILGSILILVPDPKEYVFAHIKGICQFVADEEIPKEWQKEYKQVKRELRQSLKDPDYQVDYDYDLESLRVNALYILNSLVSVSDVRNRLHQSLKSLCSDQGPLDLAAKKVAENISQKGESDSISILELGSCVGGFFRKWVNVEQGSSQDRNIQYLGVDHSFLSTAIARHFHLGAKPGVGLEKTLEGFLKFPGDLLNGPLSERLKLIPLSKLTYKRIDADFIVADVTDMPVAKGAFDQCVALNIVDMLPEPVRFIKTNLSVLKKGGRLVLSSPYIWPERVAKTLRLALSKRTLKSDKLGEGDISDSLFDSAKAMSSILTDAGFRVLKEHLDVPWFFMKHARQCEVYSAHVIEAEK